MLKEILGHQSVGCGCFESPLGNVLKTTWGRPEPTSLERPLKVRLGRPLDFLLGHPQDVRLGCPRDSQIRPLGELLRKLEGDVLRTS